MTSATERLRALLTERGVEWWQSANTLGCVFTRWYSPLFGDEVCAMENGEEGLVLFDHFVTPEQAVEATLGSREQPPYDELIESLRRDWDIEASWDGLRRFWSIGLTEDGCLMRDRACKAEAENAKLRELVRIAGTYCANGLCGKDDGCPLYLGKPYCALSDRMRELGIEVGA